MAANKSTPRLAEPKVSILSPVTTRHAGSQQAVQSALDQTWPNKEVVVVDDGSTDGSLPIIRSFGEAIRVETGPNRGGNVAEPAARIISDGEWVQYLDADDYLMPDKIERQMTQFDRTQVDVAYAPNDSAGAGKATGPALDGTGRRSRSRTTFGST